MGDYKIAEVLEVRPTIQKLTESRR